MRKFRSWSSDEVKRAGFLYETGGPRAVQKSMFPEMTYPAIQQRMARLGYRKRGFKYREWTTGQIALLRDLWRAGVSRKEIASKLGLKESAVQDKARAIGLPPRRAHWRPGQRRVVDTVVDREVFALAQRLGKSRAAIAAAMVRSLVGYGKRHRDMGELGAIKTA